jgi:hypothetical protein
MAAFMAGLSNRQNLDSIRKPLALSELVEMVFSALQKHVALVQT